MDHYHTGLFASSSHQQKGMGLWAGQPGILPPLPPSLGGGGGGSGGSGRVGTQGKVVNGRLVGTAGCAGSVVVW